MRARRLRHQLVFKKPLIEKTALGSPAESFSDLFEYSVPCDVQSVRENETFVSQRIKTSSEIKFIIRYMADIDTSLRVVFDEKTYEILEVINPFFSNKELVLYAKVVS